MGKKITIDSATMMNKVFEVIEAKNIFNIPYEKIKIITHPKSYVHAIVEFRNGLIKMLAHEPDMKIPISNSINDKFFFNKSKKIDLNKLNNLNLKNVNLAQFPLVKILKKLPKYNSLYETAIITINDYFVDLFLKQKISYSDMIANIEKFANKRDILKYKKLPVKNINQVFFVNKLIILKLTKFIYKA